MRAQIFAIITLLLLLCLTACGHRQEPATTSASAEAVHAATLAVLKAHNFDLDSDDAKGVTATRRRAGVILIEGGESVTITFDGRTITAKVTKTFVGGAGQTNKWETLLPKEIKERVKQ